jgi:hypothetical protein
MRPNVRVDLGPVGLATGPAEEIGIRNLGPNPIYVTGLAVGLSGPAVGTSRIHLAPGPPGGSLPGAIAGNSRGVSWILQSQLPMHVPGWSLRAEALFGHLERPLSSLRLVWEWINHQRVLGWQVRS